MESFGPGMIFPSRRACWDCEGAGCERCRPDGCARCGGELVDDDGVIVCVSCERAAAPPCPVPVDLADFQTAACGAHRDDTPF